MRKVLIANRGEIACRIMRTCRELGLATVAIHSEADARALHVEMADEAYSVGPPPAAQSYLNAARILAVAAETGADAVHPGYGFLSEDADFAQAVLGAGLTWIGPSPQTIRQMGDKQSAREIATSAGVPILHGSRRFEPDALDGLQDAAELVGFPLLVKASAGGGGIGMRRIDDGSELAGVVASVQNAAAKAFGNATVYLERFLPKARHIEIQVFGLGNGRAAHLHERDCSLQRRFQKVIEETPAPGLPEQVRARMIEAALALCRQTRYSGAGTVEFIVDSDSFEFFFLEMNTRLQVEHPVTEMVTGIDLVALQLKLAASILEDRDLPDNGVAGCAIECRLYAENPAKSFFPSPGRLERFVLPASTDRLRIDCGYREGDTVTPFYDPMIAKIIGWGEDRFAAITQCLWALQATEVEGIKTNRDFLIACLNDESFIAGDLHTGFITAHHGRLIGAK